MEKIQGFIGSASQKSVIKSWFEEQKGWNFWDYNFDSTEMFYYLGGFKRIEAVLVDDEAFKKWKEEGKVDILNFEESKKTIYVLSFLEDVLVRSNDTNLTWCLGKITHVFETHSGEKMFVVFGGLSFSECIPYKGNEELLGRNTDPAKEYSYHFCDEPESVKLLTYPE